MTFTFTRRYQGPLRGVILDWAGTTLDYGCMAPAVAFVAIYERWGVPITTPEARIPMGAHKRDHIQQISHLDRVAAAWRDVHGRACTEEDVDAMFEAFVPVQMEILGRYADLIDGTVEAVEAFRARDLLIGSTTGYTREMMELLEAEAASRGYRPDATVCATDVPKGRPAPWMCLRNAELLGIYPMEAVVKIGDTLPDIAEGLNAGMWTIGLALTGNEVGLPADEVAALDDEVRARLLNRAYGRMRAAGAHYVVDSVADCPDIVDEIAERVRAGDRP